MPNDNEIKQEEKNGSEMSIAMELLKEVKTQSNRWMIAFLVVLFLWGGTISGFLVYMYQYDFSSYDVNSQDGGNANFIGNDGDITNGESESPYEEEKGR